MTLHADYRDDPLFEIGDRVIYCPCGIDTRGDNPEDRAWYRRRRRVAVIVAIEMTQLRTCYLIAWPSAVAVSPTYPGQALAIVDERVLLPYREPRMAQGTDPGIEFPLKERRG